MVNMVLSKQRHDSSNLTRTSDRDKNDRSQSQSCVAISNTNESSSSVIEKGGSSETDWTPLKPFHVAAAVQQVWKVMRVVPDLIEKHVIGSESSGPAGI